MSPHGIPTRALFQTEEQTTKKEWDSVRPHAGPDKDLRPEVREGALRSKGSEWESGRGRRGECSGQR